MGSGSSTSSSTTCASGVQLLLHATVCLQLLALWLLSGNVWDHGVLVSWAQELLLLLLLRL